MPPPTRMPPEYNSDAFDRLEKALQPLAPHREHRAIATCLNGSAYRFRSALAADDQYRAELKNPSGDRYIEDTAFSHFCYDWLSSVECFCMAVYHVAATKNSTAFPTDTKGMKVYAPDIAARFKLHFVWTKLTSELNRLVGAPEYSQLKVYRDALAHRQVLARQMNAGGPRSADLIPSNPKDHPADWKFDTPLGGVTVQPRKFLIAWMSDALEAALQFV